MIRGVLGSRASIGGVLGSGRGGAAAWYLAGGVSAANCVAAYQPKGAASLAASYDNNAAPGNGLADGTYDAAPGVAPTFNTATGWTFNGSSQYLTTGAPATTAAITIICRLTSNKADSSIIGSTELYDGYALRVNTPRYMYLTKQNSVAIATDTTAVGAGSTSVLAVSFSTVTGAFVFYHDGTASLSGTKTGITLTAGNILIGTNAAAYQFSGDTMQALAIYNVTLTAPQVAAISSAMSLL